MKAKTILYVTLIVLTLFFVVGCQTEGRAIFTNLDAGEIENLGDVDPAVRGSCRFGIATAAPNAANPLTSVTLNVDVVGGVVLVRVLFVFLVYRHRPPVHPD